MTKWCPGCGCPSVHDFCDQCEPLKHQWVDCQVCGQPSPGSECCVCLLKKKKSQRDRDGSGDYHHARYALCALCSYIIPHPHAQGEVYPGADRTLCYRCQKHARWTDCELCHVVKCPRKYCSECFTRGSRCQSCGGHCGFFQKECNTCFRHRSTRRQPTRVCTGQGCDNTTVRGKLCGECYELDRRYVLLH